LYKNQANVTEQNAEYKVTLFLSPVGKTSARYPVKILFELNRVIADKKFIKQ